MAKKRVRKVQKTKRGKCVGLVALLCLILGLVWYGAATTEEPPICERFQAIDADPGDRVRTVVQGLLSDYGRWLSEHPTDQVSGEALTAWAKLHNRFVPALEVAGVLLPTIVTADEQYNDIVEPLRPRLMDAGWICQFRAPVLDGERMVGSGWLAEIIASRDGQVTRWDGQAVAYRELLADHVTAVGVPGAENMFSVTDRGVVTHFLPAWRGEAHNALLAAADPAPYEPDTIGWWAGLEWAHRRTQAREQPIATEQQLFCEVLASSSAHETQHVADHQLSEVANNPAYAGKPRYCFALLMELRGMLAAIAHSAVPIYSYGHMRSLQTNPTAENYYQRAAEIGAAMIGPILKEEAEDPAHLRTLLRERAQAALARMNAQYPALVATKDLAEPNERLNELLDLK